MKNQVFILVLLAILAYTQAETRILQKVDIQDDSVSRHETYSLKNAGTPEEELVIEGTRTENFSPQDPSLLAHILETTFVADKNGVHTKYILLAAPALKSLAG